MKKKKIRVSYLGTNWVIKIKTQGQYAHGWTVYEKGFHDRDHAIVRLRELLKTDEFIEA